jgi:hypothetical protein
MLLRLLDAKTVVKQISTTAFSASLSARSVTAGVAAYHSNQRDRFLKKE